MTTSLRAIGAGCILATLTLVTGCTESGGDDAQTTPTQVTMELRPVAFVGASANAVELLPSESEDWPQFLEGLGLPGSDDAVSAATWVAAGDCAAEPVTTPDVAAACSEDGTEVFLLGAVALDQSNIASVEQMDDQNADTTASLTFDESGSAALAKLTREATSLQEPRNRIAITIDGAVVSAPAVAEEITVGQVQIVGAETGVTGEESSIQALVDSVS
jgi:hypothetical protein